MNNRHLYIPSPHLVSMEFHNSLSNAIFDRVLENWKKSNLNSPLFILIPE
jgi:hypothetical protein